MNNVLEIKNLSKAYENFKLDNVSFSLEKGYIMGFIGENGAGKTTTIKLIMNLLKKDNGDIKIFGLDNIKNEKEIKEKIGFVYDDCFFYENLSIKQNAKIFSGFYPNWDFNTFNNYLRKFNLDESQKVKSLSKGMKMKFTIALALSHKAEFLILDEPTAGLDPVVRIEVLDILQEAIENEDIGILISTHITSDLEKIADYITYINNGKIEFSKSIEEISETYKIVKGNKGDLTDENKQYLMGITENSYGFEALTFLGNTIKTKFKEDIVVEKASLEDIMIFSSKNRGMI